MKTSPRRTTRAAAASRGHQPEERRQAILNASLREFAEQGMAGARMDTIAERAGVNKALLYYYFEDKDSLYAALLDSVFQRFRTQLFKVFEADATPGQRILTYARIHFDLIAASPYYARIFQGELSNSRAELSPLLRRILNEFSLPLGQKLIAVLEQGIASGEFRAVDPMNFISSMIAVIVHYFAVGPLIRELRGSDPFAPANIVARRRAVLDFIAAALFTNRTAAVKAARQLADHKMGDSTRASGRSISSRQGK